MILALQCYPGDAQQALELTRLICDIEPAKRENDVFCISARRDVPQVFIDKMTELAEAKFGRVYVIHGQRMGTGWPAGPNDVWAETMMRISQAFKGDRSQTGVLTFEPDCVPLRANWIDLLDAAWKDAHARGKKALGHAHGEPPDHINGNAIFKVGLLREHPELNGAGRMGWDQWHGKLILSFGEDTELITQHYRLASYDREHLQTVTKKGVTPALFHGTKGLDGIQFVREMLQDGTLAKLGKRVAKNDDLKKLKNVIIRPHDAGFFSLLNNVATCCNMFPNVAVDWTAPHVYDTGSNGENMWDHFFTRNPAKGGAGISLNDYDILPWYPDWHLTAQYVAEHYRNPLDQWRHIFHQHWKSWGVRQEFVDRADKFIAEKFGKLPFIAVQVRSSANHAGEQVTGKLQTLEAYEDAIRAEKMAAIGDVLLYVAASDEETAAHFVHKLRADVYASSRAPDRSVDPHTCRPQTLKDAEDVFVEVLIMSRALTLIHPVSNMATAALYMNPRLRSVYLP